MVNHRDPLGSHHEHDGPPAGCCGGGIYGLLEAATDEEVEYDLLEAETDEEVEYGEVAGSGYQGVVHLLRCHFLVHHHPSKAGLVIVA